MLLFKKCFDIIEATKWDGHNITVVINLAEKFFKNGEKITYSFNEDNRRTLVLEIHFKPKGYINKFISIVIHDKMYLVHSKLENKIFSMTEDELFKKYKVIEY